MAMEHSLGFVFVNLVVLCTVLVHVQSFPNHINRTDTYYCNETETWTCHTVQPGENLYSIAANLHVHPQQICDYNRDNLGDCSTVDAGVSIRIPRPRCAAREGIFSCYTVQKDNQSICDIAYSETLLSCEGLLSHNSDVLYVKPTTNTTGLEFPQTLYKGMFVLLPNYHCIATDNFTCYTVQKGDTLYSLATQFSESPAQLYGDNLDVIPPFYTLTPGMELRVRRKCEDRPGADYCYRVQQGDSLAILGPRFGVPWPTLCTYNDIKNCSMIFAGYEEIHVPVLH